MSRARRQVGLAEEVIDFRADVGHPRRKRRNGGIDEGEIIERAGCAIVAADGEVRRRGNRGQRKVISTIAAPSNVLEPEVAAFGALHGVCRSPFWRSGSSAEIDDIASS